MPRKLTVAAAQVGAVNKDADRKETLSRLIKLLHDAHTQGATLIVFPEITFTTFFPRHLFHSQEEVDQYFEHEEDLTTSPDTAPFFDEVKKLKVDVYVGYAERTSEGLGYNACVYFSGKSGKVLSKYRKVHLPGTKEPYDDPSLYLESLVGVSFSAESSLL